MVLKGANQEPPLTREPSAGLAGAATESHTEPRLAGTHFCCRPAELVGAGSSCLDLALTGLAAAGMVRAVADSSAQHPIPCCRSAEFGKPALTMCLQVWWGQPLRAAMTRRTTTMRLGRTRTAMRTVSAGIAQGLCSWLQ